MIVHRRDLSPIHFSGLEIYDFTSQSGSATSFALVCVHAGASHARAWSKRSDKYYFLISGSVRFTLDSETQVLNEGDFCLVKQGRQFSYENVGSSEARFALVHTPSFDLASEVFVES